MKIILTGMNGTVAPVVGQWLTDQKHVVIPWNRSVVPTDDEDAMRDFIRTVHPHAFLHIATGSPDWAAAVARICAKHHIKFLFTSSVSVFSGSQAGPLTPNMEPDANDEYGRYKLACEHCVRAACPEAIIVRLGWQIGSAPGSNTMIDYLHRAETEQGRIEGSSRWRPSCSFLQDTAASLGQVLLHQPAGLYHCEGNPGLTFHEIATGLNRLLGNPWHIVPGETPVYENLMLDPRVPVRSIASRLPGPA